MLLGTRPREAMSVANIASAGAGPEVSSMPPAFPCKAAATTLPCSSTLAR
jgi:hypothetical protein